jgi:hypothetical protein
LHRQFEPEPVGPFGWQTGWVTSSDGLFHCYESHQRPARSHRGNLIDGNLLQSTLNVDFGTSTPRQRIEVGENQSTPNNGFEMYTDYDDFAISATGRIGCLTGGPITPPPSAPANLRLQ